MDSGLVLCLGAVHVYVGPSLPLLSGRPARRRSKILGSTFCGKNSVSVGSQSVQNSRKYAL